MATARPLILHCFDGLGIGGAERGLVLLLRYSPPDMFDHAVCHVGPRADLAEGIKALGFPVYNLSGGRRYSLLALVRLFHLVRQLRPGLIHADHAYGKLYARIVSRVLGIPLLVTMGLMISDSQSRRRAPANLVKRLLAHIQLAAGNLVADHTVAISGVVRQGLINGGFPASRVSIVPRGLNPDDFQPLLPEELADLRAALDLPREGPILINVARLIPRKGQETILRAMPLVRREYPRVRLLLVGDGPSRPRYEALAVAVGIVDAVRFLGNRDDVPQLLQLADIFVFPSRQEGLGVALLEAMASSRACVVSDLPVFREVLGGEDAGVFVPPDRPDLLAEAILGVLADPARAVALGRRAREIVITRFDIRHNAREFAQVCMQLVGAAQQSTSRG